MTQRRRFTQRSRGAGWAAVALTITALTGCAAAEPTSTAGYISQDGTITTVPAGERQAAPELSGEGLDGEPLSTAELAGDVLVVNVWGSWCPPCRAEAPALRRASERYADQGVSFLGLLVRDEPEAARAFNRRHDIDYPSIVDRDGRQQLGFADSLPAQAIPTTWVIDREGRVAARVVDEVSAATLSGLLDDVLAEAA